MIIVSANYLDRTSPNRWLIRDETEHHSQARVVKSVVATGVTFVLSDQIETGFGCGVVAKCKTAEEWHGQEPAEKTTSLRFDGFYTFYDSTIRAVKSCKRLELGEDGSIMALLNEPAATRTAVAEEVRA